MPTDLPDLAASLSLLDAITLRALSAERRRVPGQVTNFARLPVALWQARTAPGAAQAVWGRFFQHLRLRQPGVRVGRNLHNEGFAPLIQTVEKRTVATVEFVGGPGHHPDSIAFGPVDQIERDLRFRLEDDVVGNMVFFRRCGFSAHSLGRYSRASSMQSNPRAE